MSKIKLIFHYFQLQVNSKIMCSKKKEPALFRISQFLLNFGACDQRCRKLFRAGGANRSKGASRAPEASRVHQGRIVQKRHFAMFCYYNSLLILAKSKHKKIGTLLPPGQRATGAVTYSGPAVLHPWPNLTI